jgi:hypothetical protein
MIHFILIRTIIIGYKYFESCTSYFNNKQSCKLGFCFIFERFQVQMSARRAAVLTEFVIALPQSLQAMG